MPQVSHKSRNYCLNKDKKIKYLIMKVLEKQGIYVIKENKKLEFLEARIKQSASDFSSYPQADLIAMLKDDIRSLIDCDLN